MIDELLIKLIGGKLPDKERADLHFANFVEVSKLCGDLERENEQLRAKLADAHQSDLYDKLIDRSLSDKKDGEIERLQHACDYYHEMCSHIADKNFTANEEIDRLRKELSEWKALADMPQSSPAPRMTCTEHGIKYLCFDDFMGGVWWCSMCAYERVKR